MLAELSPILRQYFQKESLAEISKEDINFFLTRFPYSATARYLAAQKEHDAGAGKDSEAIVSAGLYLNNPLWLDFLLKEVSPAAAPEKAAETPHADLEAEAPTPEVAQVPSQSAGFETAEPVTVPFDETLEFAVAASETEPAGISEPPLAFQSYHTIDYFASQGIRLQQSDLSRDKLGQQLKSFTEWLKSMKKLPASEGRPAQAQDEAGQAHVIEDAEASIAEKEVVTEAMAEVWAKQGNKRKATEIYTKLSLQNPAKSGYFAAKIEQLK